MENYFLFFKHTIIKTKAMNKLTDSKLFQFCKCVTDVLANVSEEQNEKSTVQQLFCIKIYHLMPLFKINCKV